jgi:hypothetical protein
VFESLEKRRNQGSLWKAFGVVTSIFVIGVVLWMKCSHIREEAKIEAYHEQYRQQRADDEKPREVELPGMTIVAPGAGQESGDYEQGMLVGTTPIEFGVQWQRHGMIERSTVVDLVIGSYNKANNWQLVRASNREIKVAGFAAHEDTLKTQEAIAIVTQLECGKRQVTIIVDGFSDDVRKYNDPMVASFRCKPSPEIDLDRPPVVVDAVNGWTKSTATHTSNILELRGPHGEDLRAAKLGPKEGSVADVITGLVDNTAIQLTSKPTTRNEKVFWQGINAADQKPAAVLAWRCDDDRVAFITIIAPKSVDDAVAVADTGRCLGPDDAVPIY